MTYSFTSTSSNFFLARCFFRRRNKWKSWRFHKQQQFVCEFPLDVHLLRWEIVWRNAPRIWRGFRSALPFQTRLTQIKPVLPLSNEHCSQVKDQGRRQCYHNKHKNFPYQPSFRIGLVHLFHIIFLTSRTIQRFIVLSGLPTTGVSDKSTSSQTNCHTVHETAWYGKHLFFNALP